MILLLPAAHLSLALVRRLITDDRGVLWILMSLMSVVERFIEHLISEYAFSIVVRVV